MPRMRFARKLTRGKSGTKHAGTLLANIGPESVPTKLIIIESSAGQRQENIFELQDNAFSDETCRSGDLIKFVNIHIQAASRNEAGADNRGWIEYAVVWKREGEADVTTARLGTLTLGTVATNLYRNDCIWTGFIPIFNAGSHGAELSLKMPKTKQFLKVGEELVMFVSYRAQSATALGFDDNRVILSYNYKAYS